MINAIVPVPAIIHHLTEVASITPYLPSDSSQHPPSVVISLMSSVSFLGGGVFNAFYRWGRIEAL